MTAEIGTSKLRPKASPFADRSASVLLVDDEPFNLDLLEQELAGFELEIRTAADGRQALERVTESPPDMIFLDLMMPELDGFGVLEQLQSNEEWRLIPVVIISASSDVANIVRAIEMGAVDFLPKPFEPTILHARLISGLERKRLRDLEAKYLSSLQREMEIGRQIQAGFLPDEIPQPEGWTIQAHFQAAREVAGDFYDVFKIGQGRLGLLVGDVTDKGVGSAMYMALYRSLLRASLLAEELAGDVAPEDCTAPDDCLRDAVKVVNRYICKFHKKAMFATFFIGILDVHENLLFYVNAGHDPPYFLRDGTIERTIKATGPMVGAIEEAVYRVETLVFEPGDRLVMYSDGIPDARDARDEMFGREQFRKLLESPSAAPRETFNKVLAAVEAHLEGADQFDDITLMIVSKS
jgi:serine phosphatase RsbU (regulator of sigma subunit)